MSTLKERLTEIARDQGQRDPVPNRYFETLLKLSSGRISQLFAIGSGDKLGAKSLSLLAKLGYNPDWVQTGKGNKRLEVITTNFDETFERVVAEQSRATYPINLSEHPDLRQVPRVKFKLSAGVSGFAVEPEDGNGKPIFFRKDWFALNGYRPEKLFAVRVSGASMEPSLWDGDLVVINTDNTTPRDGEVYAVNFEGELCIKRLRRDAGEWWATSDNSDQRRFAQKRCTEDVKIIGRVVYKQSERI